MKGQDNKTTIKISEVSTLQSSTYKLSTAGFNDQQLKKLNGIIGRDIFCTNTSITDDNLLVCYNDYISADNSAGSSVKSEWGQTRDGFEGRLKTAKYKLAGLSRSISMTLNKHSGTNYCDLGSGDGSMGVVFAEEYKLKPIFMDINNYLDKSIISNVNFEAFDPSKDITSSLKYGIISCFHILHHIDSLEDIKARLLNIYDLLMPDGVLICREHDVSDPTTYSFVSYLHIAYEIKELTIPPDRYKEYLDNYRLCLMSIGELASLACACGFKVVGCTRPIGFDHSYYILFQKI